MFVANDDGNDHSFMTLLSLPHGVPFCGSNRHHPGGKVAVGPTVISKGLPNDFEEPDVMCPADLDAINAPPLELDHWEKVDKPVGTLRMLQ